MIWRSVSGGTNCLGKLLAAYFYDWDKEYIEGVLKLFHDKIGISLFLNILDHFRKSSDAVELFVNFVLQEEHLFDIGN